MQYIGIMYMSYFVACCLSAGVDIAICLMLFTEDIKLNLQSINNNVKMHGKSDTQVLMDFCDTIEMHAVTKRLSFEQYLILVLMKEFNHSMYFAPNTVSAI